MARDTYVKFKHVCKIVHVKAITYVSKYKCTKAIKYILYGDVHAYTSQTIESCCINTVPISQHPTNNRCDVVVHTVVTNRSESSIMTELHCTIGRMSSIVK